jgi:hypothetical protein
MGRAKNLEQAIDNMERKSARLGKRRHRQLEIEELEPVNVQVCNRQSCSAWLLWCEPVCCPPPLPVRSSKLDGPES